MKCAVITPVGPGHEQAVEQAKASVEAAKAHSMGPFSSVEHVIIDDTKAALGRSAARNKAVRDTDADWIFFLDADDLMAQGAFESFADFQHLDAVWGSIIEVANGHIAPRPGQLLTIDSIDDLTSHDPYLTIQMGHFVRAEIAKDTPFNNGMDCGEDFDYYLRLWDRYKCAKVPRIFFINIRGNHSTGPRSANGKQWREAVEKMIGKHKIDVPTYIAEPEHVRLEHIVASSSLGLPSLEIAPEHKGRWLICAGGPSLSEEISKIRSLKKKGGKVVAVNGSHDYLLSRGITPDYFVMSDPRQHNARFVAKPKKSVRYMIAADCHPDVFANLSGMDVSTWMPIEYNEKIKAPAYIGGGSTVGLRAISIGHALGFRDIHLFGFDGCAKLNHHAYNQPENDGDCLQDVSYDGKTYQMTNWMIAQAEDFEEFVRLHGDKFRLKVHSDGVIKRIYGRYSNTVR